MRRQLTALVALTALMGLPGCVFDFPGFVDDGDDIGYVEDNLATSDGRLDGEVGDVTNVTGEARIHSAYTFDSYAYVELRARGEGGVLMQGFHIDGFDQLQPGDDLSFNGTSGYYDGTATVHVSTTGCAGPRDDSWDYDQSADDVNIQVEEGPEPGTLRLNITSRFDSYYSDAPQTVQSSVTIAVR